MPSVEDLLHEAELAIANGEAATGQWPPKDPSTTFWWADTHTHTHASTSTATAARATSTSASFPSSSSTNQHTEPSKAEAEGHTSITTTPLPQDSLDAFLTKKSPSIAKRFDKVERLRLQRLKHAREKTQQQAQSAPLLDLVSVRPKVVSRHSPNPSPSPNSNPNHKEHIPSSSTTKLDESLLKEAFEYGKFHQREVEPSALMLNGHASLHFKSNLNLAGTTKRRSMKRIGRKPNKSPGQGQGLRRSGRKGGTCAVKRGASKGGKVPFRARFEFDNDGRGEDESKATARLRTEDLVRQLTQGTYVKKLQRELAQSKESMKHSDAFIKRATAQWFRSPQNQ